MDESCARVAAKMSFIVLLTWLKMVDESCMFSCHNSALKLLLQVVDERWICIVLSAAEFSATRWWIWGVCWIWLKVVYVVGSSAAGWWIRWVCWIWLKIYKAWKVYKIYKLHFPPPTLFIDLSSSDDKLKNNERKLASSATKYGSSSLQRSMAQILLCD